VRLERVRENEQGRDERRSESGVDWWLGGHERSQTLPFASECSSHRHRLEILSLIAERERERNP